jgi:hypothetical protein
MNAPVPVRAGRAALPAVDRVLQGGIYNGVTFSYMTTDEDLHVITELFDWPGTRRRCRSGGPRAAGVPADLPLIGSDVRESEESGGERRRSQ